VYGTNGVTQDPAIARLITSVATVSGGPVVCNSEALAFAESAPLENGQFWCVDGDGVKKEIAGALGSGVTACP
jgi:hypothetical protein